MCKSFLSFIHSHHVLIMLDNTTAVFYINKQGGARSTNLCIKVVKFWNWCIRSQITLSVACLPGGHNVLMDSFSRQFVIVHVWEFHDTVLHNIFAQWGIPTRDLLASQTNRKCATYCCKGAHSYRSQDNALFLS